MLLDVSFFWFRSRRGGKVVNGNPAAVLRTKHRMSLPSVVAAVTATEIKIFNIKVAAAAVCRRAAIVLLMMRILFPLD